MFTVVKEAASLKKNNLFGDSTDLQCVSQSSLADSRTPPLSAPSSPPPVQASVTLSQRPELKIDQNSQQTTVIPALKITPETPQADLPPTLPNNSSSPIPDVSSSEPETISPAEESSSSQPEATSSTVKDEDGSVSSDRAVYLNSTNTESPVPLADASENGNVEEDASSSQSETKVVQPDGHVEETVDKTVSVEAAPPSEEDGNHTQDNPVSSLDCDGPVDGAVALAADVKCSVSAVSEEESADGVQSIRDLIMEVIEVEETARPCGENLP